jgi:hypothetical protein
VRYAVRDVSASRKHQRRDITALYRRGEDDPATVDVELVGGDHALH